MEEEQRFAEQDDGMDSGGGMTAFADHTPSADDAIPNGGGSPDGTEPLHALPPLANQIVDSAIDNMTRKLVAGYRNKKNAKPNSKNIDVGAETREALKAVSAESVMEVANRGQAWKEMVQKSLSRGISSLSTLEFDGEIQIRAGQRPGNFKGLPESPGVYVVYDDTTGRPVYVGDSGNMRSRWNAGHRNEYEQGQKPGGKRYKLADEFENGCTVKFIKMESTETAAALEAHLIKENFDSFKDIPKKDDRLGDEQLQQREQALAEGMLKNKRGELETEQGTRSNQEAKKLKDASADTASLLKGATGEALKNVGYDLVERLTTTTIKAVKDEMVDILRGGKAKIAVRIKRLLNRILAVLKGIIDDPMQLARGLVEFIVNALSKTIGQILNLARNIFDLANGAWNLYRGAETMSREELVRKISETIIVSGTLVIWDALDPVIEAQLVPVLGPFAPYVSAAVVAIGFGLSSYALQGIVTYVIDAVVAFKQGVLASLDAARDACDQLIRNAEKELEMLADLGEYLKFSLQLMHQMQVHTTTLSSHDAIQPMDVHALLPNRS